MVVPPPPGVMVLPGGRLLSEQGEPRGALDELDIRRD